MSLCAGSKIYDWDVRGKWGRGSFSWGFSSALYQSSALINWVQPLPKWYFGSHSAIVSVIPLGALFWESCTLTLGQDSGIYESLDFPLILNLLIIDINLFSVHPSVSSPYMALPKILFPPISLMSSFKLEFLLSSNIWQLPFLEKSTIT